MDSSSSDEDSLFGSAHQAPVKVGSLQSLKPIKANIWTIGAVPQAASQLAHTQQATVGPGAFALGVLRFLAGGASLTWTSGSSSSKAESGKGLAAFFEGLDTRCARHTGSVSSLQNECEATQISTLWTVLPVAFCCAVRHEPKQHPAGQDPSLQEVHVGGAGAT